MIPAYLTEIDHASGCMGFSLLSREYDGERRTLVYLRDGDGRLFGSLLLEPDRSDSWCLI
jgi:hypothetical protein